MRSANKMSTKEMLKKLKRRMAPKRLFSGESIYQGCILVIVFLLMLLCLYPLIYVLGASLMTEAEWIMRDGLFLFPHHPTLDAYADVFREVGIYTAFGVSVARTVVGSVLSVLCCAITGYALHVKGFWGQRFLSVFLFITMVYGGGLISSYLVIDSTGLRNTFGVFIIPGLLSGWTTLLFKQNFNSTPASLSESARIDGASEPTILFQIMLPANMPTVAVMLFFAAVGHWNSWFDAQLYINSDNMSLIPFQLYLKSYFSQNANSGASAVQNLEAKKMVIAIVGILPVLLVYPFFLKYFTKGVYMGAVKE